MKFVDLNDKNIFKNNFIINSYRNKKSHNLNNHQNIRTILFNNEKLNQLQFNPINKNNILKVNQAVNTSKAFLYNNKDKTKLNYRPLSNHKNLMKLSNMNDINEICFLARKKLKFQKCKKTMRDYFTERLKRDKYAYIYLSDNAESIKFSRRVNYNPLDV